MADKLNLGANYDVSADSVVFRLFSEHAERVVLSVFEGADDTEPLASFELTRGSSQGGFDDVGSGGLPKSGIWQTSVKKYVLFDLKKPFYYGFMVFGNGKDFNPDKIAYDPYALELSYVKGSKDFDTKSVFTLPEVVPPPKPFPPRPFKDEIIGEVHIKDLSINADIEEAGTLAGAGKMAPMLKKFGITMVEFLPLNEFDEAFDGGNYWGYMPLSYFALHKEYAYDKERVVEEFARMVSEFHAHGIKVCMDVVYNHSAYNASFKLIDKVSYYKINENGEHCNNCGCGNDLNCANEAYGNLVADSIAYFANLGVDAFRFDLAAALLDVNCKGDAKYCKENSLAAKLPQMLAERGVKVAYTGGEDDHEGIVLIAEPWTCGGENAYQLGKFPDFWWQWNDVARNTIRANSLQPEHTNPLGLKNVLEGSLQLFEPTRAVNYVASHDGLTLNDLNSYCVEGWEIAGDHYGDFDAQKKAIKKQIALLLLSSGAAMLQVGDLIAHSKNGNHNSYQEDSEVNWLDFALLSKDGKEKEIFDFWGKMLDFRREFRPQDTKRTYFNEWAQEIAPDENNENHFFAFTGENFYVVTSKSGTPIEFKLPDGEWELLINCGKSGPMFEIEPFSLLIFTKRW